MLVLMMSACGNTQSAKETSDMKQPTEEIQASHNILVTYFSSVGNQNSQVMLIPIPLLASYKAMEA